MGESRTPSYRNCSPQAARAAGFGGCVQLAYANLQYKFKAISTLPSFICYGEMLYKRCIIEKTSMGHEYGEEE